MNLQDIRNKSITIGVIGLGYVGLPLIREFNKAGFRIVGFDIDKKKVASLNAGRSYIGHIPHALIQSFRKGGRFRATADFSELRKADAIIICVPTPLDTHRNPDLSAVVGTAETICRYLRKGQLVVLESTTYPGTTDEELRSRMEAAGFKVGRDVFLAFSPEREDPGNPKFTTSTIPKVVGADDPKSLALAKALYENVVVKVHPVSSTRAAEATKILENIYRCINIAAINELKIIFHAMGIDIWEVIEAAATKPFGFQKFTPGPGLGGHCIPIDPFYLSWKAKEFNQTARFIELAGEVNCSMPHWVIERLAQALSEQGKPLKGSKILVLGMAYKPDIDDDRESPSRELIQILMERGAKVSYHDPHVPHFKGSRHYSFTLRSTPLTARRLQSVDAVLISTDHTRVDYDLVVRHAKLVVDTRNATKHVRKNRQKIVKS
ncbi:MAG: nucleotide sugar dehydrogenase [Planctomycetota bacterium]